MTRLPEQAFSAGADLDPRSERLLEARTEAEGQLSGAQLAAAMRSAQQQRCGGARQRRFTVEIGLRFPEACHSRHASHHATPPAERRAVQALSR